MTRVDFDRLTSRTGYAYLIGTGVAAAAVLGYLVVQEPGQAVYALLLPLLVLGVVLVGVRHRQWLELGGDGPVLVQRRLLGTARVPLRRAQEVRLSGNGAGSLQLVASDGSGKARAPVLAMTPYVERSQPADVLGALVDALDGVRAKGAAAVRDQLAAQHAHVRGGGTAATSPLATKGGRPGGAGATGAVGSR